MRERDTIVDQSDFSQLRGWQLGIFAAGCTARLAPIAETIAWPLPRKVLRACTDAAWDGGGVIGSDLAEHLDAGIRRVFVPDSVDEFGVEVANLLMAAGQLVATCRDGDHDDARQAGLRAIEVWESLDGAAPAGNWAARELRIQEQTASVLARMPAPDAVRLVKAITHDEEPLREALDVAGWNAPTTESTMPSEAAWSPVPDPPLAPARIDHLDDLPVLVGTKETECPAGPDGLPRPPYRPGDVLRVACDFEPTEVTKVSAYDTFVRWPWPRPKHPGSSQAFARDAGRELWTPFQLRPAAQRLSAGDPCMIGIEPTVVYTMQVWTSRLGEHLLSVLPRGRTAIGGWAEEAGAIEPYDDAIELALAFRAYDFLEDGDVVIDAAGRPLTFAPPLLFTGPDGALSAPIWPLTLAHSDPVRAAAVPAATATGTHREVFVAWQRAAGARLPHRDFLRSWFQLPDLRAWPFGRP